MCNNSHLGTVHILGRTALGTFWGGLHWPILPLLQDCHSTDKQCFWGTQQELKSPTDGAKGPFQGDNSEIP